MEWDYYLLIGILSIGGILFSVAGIVGFKKYRLIKGLALSKIAEITRGIVKIRGKVSAKQRLKSPFSKKECVYYRYEIETYRTVRRGKKTTHRWVRTGFGEDCVPFTCDDGTGRAFINPEGAEFYPKRKKQFYQKGNSPIRKFISALRTFKIGLQEGKRSTLDTSGWGLQPIDPKNSKKWRITTVGDRRYDEYYIEPGEQVLVVGTARQDTEGRKKISKPGKMIVSNIKPESLLKKMKRNAIIILVVGVCMFLGGMAFLLKFIGFY